MAGSQRRGRDAINIWPGFVDALATVLMAFIFLILLFVVAQFYLSSTLSDRNTALARLESQLQDLGETLAMERRDRRHVEENLSQTYSELHSTLAERDQLSKSLRVTKEDARRLKEELAAAEEEVTVNRDKLKMRLSEIASLQADISALRSLRDKLESRIGDLSANMKKTRQSLGAARDRSKALEARLADARERTQLAQKKIDNKDIRLRNLVAQVEERDEALAEQKELTDDAQARIDNLRAEIRELSSQIASLSKALDLSKETVSTQKTKIENLGDRLNVALAQKVEELSRYRSEFFGRLRQVLGDIDEIRIVGDRFMFQSELFFESGAAEIGAEGKQKLDRLAEILNQVTGQIPNDVPWILQVEGHTDRRPISTDKFPSNWELSTARATNIVHYLIDQGIPPQRLAAAGFGEYQPLETGSSKQAYARNRRIEMRLTSR